MAATATTKPTGRAALVQELLAALGPEPAEYVMLPLSAAKIRLAALQAVLASVEGGRRPETFELPLALARKFTVPPEYAFAERLLDGERWESLCIAFDLSPEEAFGKLVRVARGATSPTWGRTYRRPNRYADNGASTPVRKRAARTRARRKGG